MAQVTIVENGREGRVEYSDGLHSISGYWTFGGNEVVAIVSLGSREDWQRSHAWAVGTRASILRLVADEVIRQKAPSCTAQVDEQSGDISLLQGRGAASSAPTRPSTRQAQAVAFVNAFRDLRMMLATGLLVALVIVGVIVWLSQKAMMVSPARGIPLNESVRFDGIDPARSGIATLIQTTDPHFRDISGRGGNETTSLSILVTPLDGSPPHLIPVAGRISGHGYQLARIMGSDGRTVWFDAMGLSGVRLNDFTVVTPEHLQWANPGLDPTWWEDPRGMDIIAGKLHVMRIDRSAAVDIDPDTWKATPTAPKPSNVRFDRHEPANYLAAGILTTPRTWLALLSADERARDFKPGKWIRPVERAGEGKLARRLTKAALEPSPDGDRYRVRTIAPVGDMEFLQAAFLRMNDKSEPLRVENPDSALMIHTSAPGLAGTLVLSRVDFNGDLLWSADTGLDRFSLKQILPGADVVAFVGTRPPIPDKLSEPLIVLVDTKTGKLTSHSLWQ